MFNKDVLPVVSNPRRIGGRMRAKSASDELVAADEDCVMSENIPTTIMLIRAAALLRLQCASSPCRTLRIRTEYPQDGPLPQCALVRPWAADSRDTELYAVPPHDAA